MDNITKVESNLFDKVSYVFGADLQILENSITGEVSIGWAPIGSDISNGWRAENGEEIVE